MKITRRQIRQIIRESFEENQKHYFIPAETWLGDWEGWPEELATTHPHLELIHQEDTSDMSIGIIVGTKEDLWAFESKHINPANYPESRAAFERRAKPYRV